MIIVTDTRETLPLLFPSHPEVSAVKKAALSVGDYTGESASTGHFPLAFERKSRADLFGTMGKGYPRFKKELARAEELGIQMVLIIECPMEQVWNGYEHSTLKGPSVIRKLFTLWMRYDLIPVFCADRREMARYILESLLAVEREWKHGN